jgi:hypothetical protein
VSRVAGAAWWWRQATKKEQKTVTNEPQGMKSERKSAGTTAIESELLQRLRLDAANRAFDEDRANEGVAMLVSLLEDHPTNQAAVLRLHSALLYRNWAMPVVLLLRHASRVCSAQFSPDGTRVVTATDNCTARLWDVPSESVDLPNLLSCATYLCGRKRSPYLAIEALSQSEEISLGDVIKQLRHPPPIRWFVGWWPTAPHCARARTVSEYQQIPPGSADEPLISFVAVRA